MRQLIHRLVLWNIDLTLLDVAKVTRAAYAEAFAAVIGRPLVQLPQMVGRTEPEIFFDALGRNGVSLRADGESERLLAPFGAEYATRLAARRDQLAAQGTLLPGAAEALRAVAGSAAWSSRCSPGRAAPTPRSSCAPSALTGTWTWASAGSPAPSLTPRARCCAPPGCGRRKSTR